MAWPAASSGPATRAQPVERTLQNIGGGEFVDHLGAPPMRHLGVAQRALGANGGETLVPEGDGQIDTAQKIDCKLPNRLAPRTLAPVQADGLAPYFEGMAPS